VVRVAALDSLGMALEGDALKGAVVIEFFRDRIDQLKRSGVSVLIVDHQSGLRPGESYQSKAQYGSVYKGYLSRSRLQLELDERNEVGTRVIVRQNKTNFGPPQVPFVVHTLFDEKIGGTLHMAVGAGYPQSGSKNQSAVHWDMILDLRNGSEVHVDDELFIKDGEFVV
jgi:hypothetical protein